jgi:predicted metal-dependent phosphoesterase TrpH
MSIKEYKNMVDILGMKTVCITDHHTLKGADQFKKDYKENVLTGVEVTTGYGDFLVYSTDRAYLKTLTFEEEDDSLIVVPKSFNDIQKRDDSITIWAHPTICRISEVDMEIIMDKIDALELYNGHIVALICLGTQFYEGKSGKAHLVEIKELADKYGKKCTGASDAHADKLVMMAWTEFEKDITTQDQFIKEFKAGNFKPCVHPDYEWVIK